MKSVEQYLKCFFLDNVTKSFVFFIVGSLRRLSKYCQLQSCVLSLWLTLSQPYIINSTLWLWNVKLKEGIFKCIHYSLPDSHFCYCGSDHSECFIYLKVFQNYFNNLYNSLLEKISIEDAYFSRDSQRVKELTH